jgi:uncharacterized protein DUF2784
MSLLADFVLVVHFLFIVFVIFGGLFVLKWPKVIWIHIPCALWGVIIELFGWICPLTYLEQYLREASNTNYYDGTFIQHYLLPVIYPAGLTANTQLMLGFIVIIVNLIVYSFVLRNFKS